ncbi:MAG: hypothetical protein AMXMBFR37_06920 [Steroidobacteraceae bacterium]
MGFVTTQIGRNRQRPGKKISLLSIDNREDEGVFTCPSGPVTRQLIGPKFAGSRNDVLAIHIDTDRGTRHGLSRIGPRDIEHEAICSQYANKLE